MSIDAVSKQPLLPEEEGASLISNDTDPVTSLSQSIIQQNGTQLHPTTQNMTSELENRIEKQGACCQRISQTILCSLIPCAVGGLILGACCGEYE